MKTYACTFGALLAVVLAPAGVARADNTDTDFASYLQSHGINLGTATQTANLARTMCQDLENGNTQKDEVEQLTDSHRLSQAQAEIFIGAATADYCPGKHPASPNG